jgi:hypothetical protein
MLLVRHWRFGIPSSFHWILEREDAVAFVGHNLTRAEIFEFFLYLRVAREKT